MYIDCLSFRDIGLTKKDEHRPAPRRSTSGPPPPMDDPRDRQMNDPCKFNIHV